MPVVTFQAVTVKTESPDHVGRLAFCDGELVAVLVRLDAPSHLQSQQGRWFLEAGFGPCGRNQVPSFPNLDEAEDWITRQVGTMPVPRPMRRMLCGMVD